MRHFRMSILLTAACLFAAGWWGHAHSGWTGALEAIGIAAILGVMEVSLSFDNAVLNASVLKNWNTYWQSLFLGVGIIIAVFGMRLLFPLLIVSRAADLGLFEVWQLALHDPQAYSTHLSSHHAEVAAFGGMFLLLVFLDFLFDHDRERHWLGRIEKKLGALGKLPSVSLLMALGALLASLTMVADAQKLVLLLSGLWGVLIYIGIKVLSNVLESSESAGSSPAGQAGELVKRGGIGAFLYLEVLDASFSLDGVVGAFAITTDVVIIMLGLAIGAIFVRSITVYLVRQDTLDDFVYLEHGAHYAIGVLALIMLASIKYHVPELFTGLAGVAFIVASLYSSIRHKNRPAGAAS